MKRLLGIATLAMVISVLVGGFLLAQGAQNKRVDLLNTIARLEGDIQQIKARAIQSNPSYIQFPKSKMIVASSKEDATLILQQKMVKFADERNISLTTFGPTRSVEETEHPTVAFQMESQADYAAFLQFLQDLSAAEIPIAISNAVVRRTRSRQSDALDVTVFVQLSVWTFWGNDE